jgi:SET domain-containing protein
MPRDKKFVVRASGVHGKGVFAARDLAKGERIIEYKGEHITWEQALKRHPHNPLEPNHTFFFDIDEGMVIDGGAQGNSARWINHSCSPNCKAEQIEMNGQQRVFISARKNISAGDELFYDYGLTIDARLTKKLKKEYQCLCGSKKCRGTLLQGAKE